MGSKIFIVAVCLVLVIYEVNAARPGKKKKPKKETDDDQLTKDVQELKDAMDELVSGGTCASGKMHVYFHAGSDGHDHQVTMNDQHVHVHVHTEGDHSMHGHEDDTPHVHKATCDVHDLAVPVNGQVEFTQGSNEHHARVNFNFVSLGPDNAGQVNYTAHVHLTGDLTQGCSTKGLGPHFDPYDPDVDVGDLGVVGTNNGKVTLQHPETFLTLFGPYSIFGRSVMIHDKDGKPVCCCVIGHSKDDFHGDLPHFHLHSIDHTKHKHDHSGHSHSHSHDHDH